MNEYVYIHSFFNSCWLPGCAYNQSITIMYFAFIKSDDAINNANFNAIFSTLINFLSNTLRVTGSFCNNG